MEETGQFEKRLAELGLTLPEPQAPLVAKIKGTSLVGNVLYVSGMIPQWEGDLPFVGKIGREFTVDEGREAARLAALNVIAHARAALDGDLDRIAQIAKVSGFVNCTPDVTEIGNVVNGASELFIQVFGEQGEHSRIAVGAVSMPLGVAVEIEAVIELNA
ncbi:MAG: RidA family protein [Gammaproteobacteria bacterium]|jgi:enamine deaminase RidA (YjgF/YER057c/UK114 family)